MSEEKEIETTANGETAVVPESPKPMAFTIDFGDKKVDPMKHKTMIEKYQKRHRRGQSLSKLEDNKVAPPKHPLTGNLPRKSSFQSEGYFSSDEKPVRGKRDLTLQLRGVVVDQRMTQSFPSTELSSIISPDAVELKDVSSPELEPSSPFSPLVTSEHNNEVVNEARTMSSSESENVLLESSDENCFVEGTEFDFDKSDTVSDAGTYTLDAENYSEEQKERMSIDREFKIEQMTVQQKTEAYIKSLTEARRKKVPPLNIRENEVVKAVQMLKLGEDNGLKSPKSPVNRRSFIPPASPKVKQMLKTLSPIMSPTQNLSITDTVKDKANSESDVLNNTFTKILFPSPKAKNEGLDKLVDQGSVISVTSSGAFRSKSEKPKRKFSLSKSEVHVEAFIDDKPMFNDMVSDKKLVASKLTANLVNVQNIEVKRPDGFCSSNLPPAVGGYSGKNSPTKIPSPIHSNRPRSRGSFSSSQNVDLSDSSLDTENILKPTQNFINSLQQRLSLDSDPDSDYETKYGMQLNNTAHLLKQRANHIRHNSLDDRTMNISNKLEHFQSKNLQGIDQTYSNLFNQYGQNKVVHRIQNSPNNSPIRRSSSFSTKNQINMIAKNTNVTQKELNLCNSPNLTRNTSIQRSSSTACIKPTFLQQRRASGEHQKIDRSQFGDTESSSEDDFEKTLQKRRDLGNVTNTRCNRTFSLRRARADTENSTVKCPNTPEMRRKYQPERAISVDRKPVKTNEVQSRYLLNVTKRPATAATPVKPEPVKSAAKLTTPKPKTMAFARTDSGRFSMRTPLKTPVSSAQKPVKKDPSGKKSGGARSNSSLSSREVEFQNWKRRKSYDPMKAAAEGKRKQELAKKLSNQNAMTQSYTESNHSQDSSPSHSSSVHRSQSFHGTAAMEQLISSEEEEDLTLSADEGLSPPTPSPCEQSPVRNSWRHALWSRSHH